MENEFLQNKYTKCYFKIIHNAISLGRSKKEDYFENHHIIPKCDPFNGSNDKDNLVLLTPKEHYICHLLLVKMCEGQKKYKMSWALHKIAYGSSNLRQNYSSKSYSLVRKIHSDNIKNNHPSKTDPKGFSEKMRISALKQWENEDRRKSVSAKRSEYIRENLDAVTAQARIAAVLGGAAMKTKWSEDKEWADKQRKNLSIRTSGSNNPMYGKKIVGEHLKKLSEATSNKRWLNKDGKNVYINSEFVEEYLEKGYKRGKLQNKRKENH